MTGQFQIKKTTSSPVAKGQFHRVSALMELSFVEGSSPGFLYSLYKSICEIRISSV